MDAMGMTEMTDRTDRTDERIQVSRVELRDDGVFPLRTRIQFDPPVCLEDGNRLYLHALPTGLVDSRRPPADPAGVLDQRLSIRLGELPGTWPLDDEPLLACVALRGGAGTPPPGADLLLAQWLRSTPTPGVDLVWRVGPRDTDLIWEGGDHPRPVATRRWPLDHLIVRHQVPRLTAASERFPRWSWLLLPPPDRPADSGPHDDLPGAREPDPSGDVPVGTIGPAPRPCFDREGSPSPEELQPAAAPMPADRLVGLLADLPAGRPVFVAPGSIVVDEAGRTWVHADARYHARPPADGERAVMVERTAQGLVLDLRPADPALVWGPRQLRHGAFAPIIKIIAH
jgi:hypothetical protein